MKNIKGKRTIIFNVLGLAAVILGGVPFSEWIAEYAPYLVGAVAIVNIILRAVTTTPIWDGGGSRIGGKRNWPFGGMAVLLCASLVLCASGCQTTYTSAISEDGAKLRNMSLGVGGSKLIGKQQGAIYTGSGVDVEGNDYTFEMGTSDASDEESTDSALLQLLIRGLSATPAP